MTQFTKSIAVLVSIVGALTIFLQPNPVCGQKLDQKLQGTWKPDIERTQALWVTLKVEQADRTLERISNVTMRFDADGKFTFFISQSEVQGNWKTEAIDGSHNELKITLLVPQGEPMTGRVKFLEEGVIQMKPADESPAIFVKEEIAGAVDSTVIKRKLVAHWAGSVQATKKVNENLGVEADQIEIATNQVANMFLRIHKDGSYAFLMRDSEGATNETRGTWELGEADAAGKRFQFHAKSDANELEFTIWFENNDTLVFRLGNQAATVFSRNKPHQW